jgi:hypothetical protein
MRIEVVVENSASPSDRLASCEELPVLYAQIENTSHRTIVGMTAAFTLYDTEGEPVPAAGSNRFRWKSTAELPPNTIYEVCIPLDAAFHYVPQTPPVVERFHLQRVRFADSSVWEDPFATYAWSGRRTAENHGGNEKEEPYES